MSFKSTERILQLPGLYPSQTHDPPVVAEEADVVDVADVADVVAVDAVAETRNKKTNKPLKRSLLATNRPVRRGNATSNPMVVRTQT